MKIKMWICFMLLSLLAFGKEFTDLINEGVIYLKTEEYEKAISAFEEAKKISSENSDIYYYLAEAYFRKGEPDKAISNLQKAININSQNPSYYYTLALIYLSQNKKVEAIEALNKIINSAPLSYYGKSALKLKKDIENSEKEVQIAKKWEQLEIEEKKKKEEEMKKKEEKATTEGLPPALQERLSPETSQIIETPQSPETKRLPITTLIKRIKFGTEDTRKKASNEIIIYPSSDVNNVINDIISLIKVEKNPEIKRNLILTAGKVNCLEVIDMLLDIIKNEEELFEIRIVALDTISNLKSEKVVEELKNALTGMVTRREKEREDAKRNIQDINQKVDDLTARKIVLNSEIQNLNNRIAQIDNQLYSSQEEFPPGAPPGITQSSKKTLTDKETKKLLEEKRNSEEKIKANNEEIEKINKELEDLTVKKRKYEELLELSKRKIDISGIGASAVVIQQEVSEGYTGPGVPGFTPPEISYSQRQTDEEKNEIIFAVKLMNALANMRDKSSLSIIKKAWREFGVPGLRIYYYIALGKLGEYRNIDLMVSRLKENFPQGNPEEEIYIRANIIEVLSEYLKENPDEEIKGLIEYLAEEGEYLQIKNAAKKALTALAKVETENK